MENAIEMKGITKRFGDVLANNSIDLTVNDQEIHCLLGENGSGKTTLMNILFGIHKMDEGQIFIHGKEAVIRSPRDASDYGIGMVHQHFMLFNQNTVLENIIVGEERSFCFLQKKKNFQEIKKLVDEYEFQVDLNEKVCNLSVGMKQRVEILKVLYRGAEIIIFDEPTAILTPQESSRLMEIIKSLKMSGKTILFISHKLPEIMQIGDRITVLRKGSVIETVHREDTDEHQLACQMVGREIKSIIKKEDQSLGEKVLSVEEVPLKKNHKSCSFDIHEGEILGIAGVDGNGQLELEKIITGLEKVENGRLILEGREITHKSILERKMTGMGYIPSDRFEFGILPNYSLERNFLLGNQSRKKFSRKGRIRKAELGKYSSEIVRNYNIKTQGISQIIGTLSGGNQQKVVLGREISQNPKFILAAYPTRGLDIGAAEFVHKTLLQKRSQGCAILLISADLSEIFSLSDHIGVLFENELVALGENDSYMRDRIGLLMAGKDGGVSGGGQ